MFYPQDSSRSSWQALVKPKFDPLVGANSSVCLAAVTDAAREHHMAIESITDPTVANAIAFMSFETRDIRCLPCDASSSSGWVSAEGRQSFAWKEALGQVPASGS